MVKKGVLSERTSVTLPCPSRPTTAISEGESSIATMDTPRVGERGMMTCALLAALERRQMLRFSIIMCIGFIVLERSRSGVIVSDL